MNEYVGLIEGSVDALIEIDAIVSGSNAYEEMVRKIRLVLEANDLAEGLIDEL